MIVCLRVDERLIHGQVAMTWTKELKLNGLVVASDEAASNEIQKMTLCQKVKYVDVEKNKGEIIPAWECQVLVIPEEMPENQYLRKIYFNAETLEAIA